MRLRTFILIFTSFCVFALASGVLWMQHYFNASGPLAEEKTVIIFHGTGTGGMADLLAEQGIIAHPLAFHIAARALRDGRALQAGEYRFSANVSPREVFETLLSGKTVQRLVTFPEGLTTPQFLKILNDAEGLTGTVTTEPKTGTLLPETYGYSYGDEREEIIERMERGMRDTLEALWQSRAPDLPFLTPEEALVLASVIEKETGVPEERTRVAAVFINRLRKGMKLQSDPTVIFGITKGKEELGRALTKKDLEFDSPYNTYLYKGLPPSPICNPGRASIEAALHPADTKDLYFVATGGGGHNFSESLKGHNANVQQYRKLKNGPKAPVPDKDSLPLK